LADLPELLATMVAAGGLVVFGLASWVFGREFADRTAMTYCALPTPRSAIVLAKFGVVAVWSAGLTVMICLSAQDRRRGRLAGHVAPRHPDGLGRVR
jgi:ABC-type transport system involved in multi-copper enzyme maturation permease subunit